MAYQKTIKIHDYFAISLRSTITKCIKKNDAIEHIVACISDDRGRIMMISAGYSKMK